jgi:hypothetical protein
LDDQRFVEWRNAYGPNWVSLNACQVSRDFEQVVIQALSNPSSTQQAQGLGTACRPDVYIQWYDATVGGRPRRIRNRQEFSRLSGPNQAVMEQTLQDLNSVHGYFGAPPVLSSEVLNYFFDEIPRGGWPIVGVTYEHQPIPGVEFFSRGQNPNFTRRCLNTGGLAGGTVVTSHYRNPAGRD